MHLTVTIGGADRYLGKHGTDASHEAYRRLIAQWMAGGRQDAPASPATATLAFTVTELAVKYIAHADAYYRRPDGVPTKEPQTIRQALRVVRGLYGRAAAGEFGPKSLEAVRNVMITELKWSRSHINKQISRIVSMFKWGAAQELVPASVYHGLQAMPGLRRGRSEAREAEPVKPVHNSFIAPVVELVSDQVGAMIELQILTGMRPGGGVHHAGL